MSDDNHAIENGKGWMASIEEMITDLHLAQSGGDGEAEEACRNRIEESPLSVTVRGGWHTPGDAEAAAPEEFEVLLSTGGPALRIYGDLSEHSEPENCRLQWQDWFKPWTDCDITDEEREALGEYAACFYFGE